MKSLTLVSAYLARPNPDELHTMEETDRHPRVSFYQQSLCSDMLDERFLRNVPAFRRFVYKFLPMPVAQVLEAYIIRNRYDIVISWAERLGYPFAFLLFFTRVRPPHITLNSWISKRKKAWFLRLVHPRIDRILLWSSVQREFAQNVLNIPSSKISFIRKGYDLQFWRPMDREMDMICAAGTEMRDYTTLIEAMRGLDIRCHIAAGMERGRLPEPVRLVLEKQSLPPNVTIGRKSFGELRDLYARSRFVVVPLLPGDTDNGATCILESMAMGKTVICSRTKGQVDIVREGKTGIFVPPGDVGALREAILHLWTHPEIAESLGREARTYIEKYHSQEQFVGSVLQTAKEVMEEKKTRPPVNT